MRKRQQQLPKQQNKTMQWQMNTSKMENIWIVVSAGRGQVRGKYQHTLSLPWSGTARMNGKESREIVIQHRSPPTKYNRKRTQRQQKYMCSEKSTKVSKLLVLTTFSHSHFSSSFFSKEKNYETLNAFVNQKMSIFLLCLYTCSRCACATHSQAVNAVAISYNGDVSLYSLWFWVRREKKSAHTVAGLQLYSLMKSATESTTYDFHSRCFWAVGTNRSIL